MSGKWILAFLSLAAAAGAIVFQEQLKEAWERMRPEAETAEAPIEAPAHAGTSRTEEATTSLGIGRTLSDTSGSPNATAAGDRTRALGDRIAERDE